MTKLGKENVIRVAVEDKFALIDQNNGLIHIVDAENAQAWEEGREVEIISSEHALQVAASGGTGGQNDAMPEEEYFEVMGQE